MTRRRRVRQHITRNKRKYSLVAILITIASIVWAVASNLIASAIAPYLGLPS